VRPSRRARLRASDGHARWVVLIALAGGFATSFPSVILVASLGEIADDLHTTGSVMAWVITAPLLASSVLMPALGKVGDLYGQRRVFLAGFSIATVLGAATALAPSAGVLIATRTVAQVAGAATQPTSLALIMGVVPPAGRARAMGAWSFVAAGAPALGLVAGGLLVDAVGWRSVFVLQSALSLAAIGLGWLVLDETPRLAGLRFDVAGAVTLALASGGLLFALDRAGAWGASHAAVAVAVGVAGLAGWAFVRIQGRAEQPLVPLAMLVRRPFGAPVTAELCMQAATMGSFTLVPLVLRSSLDYSVSGSVAVLLPLPVGMAALAPVGGRLTGAIGERQTALAGTGLLIVATVLLPVGAATRAAPPLVAGLALLGAANGIARPALATSAANAVHDGFVGVGMATARMASQLGAAAGITVLVTVAGAATDALGLAAAVPFSVLSVATAAAIARRPRRSTSPRATAALPRPPSVPTRERSHEPMHTPNSTTPSQPPATFLHYDDIDWADELSAPGAPRELVAAAQRVGARRKRMATGQGGFFMNHSVMPPGFPVPEHSHDHDELIVVLAGGCTMLGGGPTLRTHDAMVLRAGHRYGFTCGDEGMTFVTVRTGEAAVSL
jgi:MFS family permease/quercetin dioxygenase-like cupin family protein